MEFEILESGTRQKKECLILKGHTYRIDRSTNKGVQWRCSFNRKGCKARLHTDVEKTEILAQSGTHNHEELSQEDIERQKIRTSVKRKAEDNLTENPGMLTERY